MKKQLFFIAAFAMFGLRANAQDTIVLKTQDVIIARDIRKTDENVIAFYRQGTYYESIDTNTYTVKKNRVAGILYHDGHKDNFDSDIMNTYLAKRQYSYLLYSAKDLEQESFLNCNSEKPSYAIMWNPTLFLSNNLAFSFEYKKKKNAVELELAYIYPFAWGSPYSAIGGTIQPDWNFPVFCYQGISTNLILKRYCRAKFYYGLSALFKYEYFKNIWIEDGTTEDGYDVNSSQIRKVFGLAFSCGWRFAGKNITWEPYVGGGVRLLNSKTTYNYFTVAGYGNTLCYGQPNDEATFVDDNGVLLVPYVNFGIKVGFGWNGKK